MTGRPRLLKTLGVGAAACAACCAGSILGLIAATGTLTATGIAMFGLVGVLIAIPGLVLATRRRSRRRPAMPARSGSTWRSPPVELDGPGHPLAVDGATRYPTIDRRTGGWAARD